MMWHTLYLQLLICLRIICRALHELLDYVLICPTLMKWRKTSFSISLPSSNLTISLIHLSYYIYKHDAIDIADPNSMQDGYHELRNRPRSLESLWLSSRASECGILRSEVRFLMRTQNVFFVPRSLQDKKHLSLFLYRAQNLPSLLFCYVLLLVNVTDQLKSGTYQENLAITTSWKLLKW